MSYQVLARKYRPSNFQEMEGQEHVLKALINSLDQNRLHHAYLFTGTRGVGKTTIARILAKCFNCEKGVTATPCGECSGCVEIAEGRSVDLIEVDAASRTRVEDTRELLENVQYMPTRSRFKVYLIDEVHMLSNHSFNALLKTLEEPPEHVKFLLATTDPKKLPVTVLSRCLQFNLKNLSPERVVSYLKHILHAEDISFEEPALWQLGRAADGSMRDALSLTDQAISFGENKLTESDVRAMLGTIDHREVYELLNALIERDAAKLLEKIARLAEFGPDFEMLLSELLSVLHRVAIAQAVPEGVDNSQGDRELVQAVSKSLSREEVQLYYQIGLIGQRDLPLAPDPRDGFEMVMLRMLSFAPESLVADGSQGGASGNGTGSEAGSEAGSEGGSQGPAAVGGSSPAGAKAGPGSRPSPVADILTKIKNGETSDAKPSTGANAESEHTIRPTRVEPGEPAQSDSDEIPWDDSDGITESSQLVENAGEQPVGAETKPEPEPEDVSAVQPEVVELADEPTVPEAADSGRIAQTHAEAAEPRPQLGAPSTENADSGRVSIGPQDWNSVFEQLSLDGVTRTLAANCMVGELDDDRVVLVLNEHHASLWNSTHEKRIRKALATYLGRDISLRIDVGSTTRETPAEAKERNDEESRAQAVTAIENDENVQRLIETFDGKLKVESIVPRTHAGE